MTGSVWWSSGCLLHCQVQDSNPSQGRNLNRDFCSTPTPNSPLGPKVIGYQSESQPWRGWSEWVQKNCRYFCGKTQKKSNPIRWLL